MTRFIALVTDQSGNYATIVVQADTWSNAVNQLEDAGCEVIEDQSEDYEGYWLAELKDLDVLTIDELLSNDHFWAYP